MAVVRYPIKLNVKPSNYPLIRQITLVQGDTANIFAIELQESKQPFNIENCRVTATFKKADENVVVLEGNVVDAKNGLVDIPIYSQVVAYPGKVYCTIEVYNIDNLRLTSIMFEFNVVEQLGNDEDIESTTEYTILQSLINEINTINEVEKQRVINENNRIQNEIDRQTVFDGIVNTANTTKDGLDASIIDANNIKSLLDHSITSGNDIKVNLDTSIDNAEPILSDLNTSIDEGNQLKIDLPPLVDNANTSKTNLDTAITNANTKKAELDGSISTATTKQTELDASISTAETTKINLDNSISSANTINDTLSNTTTGTIKKATDINNTLGTTINSANTSKSNLDESIVQSTTSKTNLDSSIANADAKKVELDSSISTASTIKTELDTSITNANTINDTLSNSTTGTIKQATDINTILNSSIDIANTSKVNLDDSISDANTSKANLDSSVTIANTTKADLDTSISSGTLKKIELDDSVSNANIINDILANPTTGNIKKATDINNNLSDNITTANTKNSDLKETIINANTSKTNLDTSISTSNTAKTNLDDSISTANVIKTALDDSITEGNDLKSDLDAIISGTDYEQIISDISSLKQDQHVHTNKDTLDGLSDVDGKLKYNGQDVGIGDMTKAEFDADGDGIVDKANDSNKLGGQLPSYYAQKTYVDIELDKKVDNDRVLTDVPVDAKFTDTTYSEITEEEIDIGTSSTLRTITGRRIKYILDKIQDWISALTKADVGLGNVQDYGVATQSEAETGTSDIKYMTPLKTKQAIDKFKPKDTSELTKSDVYTKTEVDTALAGKVDNSRVLTDVPLNAKFTDTITTINGKTGAISKSDITALGIPAQDTTYDIATTNTNGLMSATDKIKLNGIEAGANKTTISNTLTSTSTTQVLSANQGKVLNDKINNLSTDVNAHKADDVQHGKIGTKEVDESEIGDKATLIYSAELGKWVVKRRPLDDLSGSPGSPYLISGTMQEGFFGEVSASEFITGDALASECGISQGTSQHSTAGWLKFAYKGEILFVAKKPIRHSISWGAIDTAKCIYGDSGDKTVVIGGKTYKVTLMRALEPTNDPKTVASATSGEVNHGSEWNRLICQIHEEAINKNWSHPDNVENDIGILNHNLGNGSQGMYNDADLIVASGDGRASWCQEMGTSTSNRMARGYYGVSHSDYFGPSSYAHSITGWRPVLRLVN